MTSNMRLPDLSRWPIPGDGLEKVALCAPKSHTFQLLPIHLRWLQQCTAKYHFDTIGETLRHLIYAANAESRPTKRLVFRIIRCLHCTVGAPAGQHAKVPLEAVVHQFQWQWLEAVTQACKIASIDKCVRIICDYYQSRVQEALKKGGLAAAEQTEVELFGRRRLGYEERFTLALARIQEQAKNSTDHQSTCSQGNLSDEENRSHGHRPTTVPLEDPAACSEADVLKALSRCQVGRKSATYAIAKGETAEETATRRAKEQAQENSQQAQQNRALIRKVLYM